jgi:prepilin-type N-terminal cleavage/methylation domain-containing protein
MKLQQIKRTNNEKGFTLIEFLLYMALLSIFMLTLTDIFVSIMQSQVETTSISAVEEDGRYIMAKLTADILKASAISVPAAFGNANNVLTITVDGVAQSYGLQANNLTLTNPQGTFNLNGNGTKITAMSFVKLGTSGKESVKIDLTVQSVAQSNGGPESRSFSTTVTRR